jgi:hypothetical protein
LDNNLKLILGWIAIHFIGFAVIAALPGCYTLNITIEPPTPQGDAGPMQMGDGGHTPPDAGPVEMADAWMASVPHGTTVLVATFHPLQGILYPDSALQNLGSIELASYGGDSVFSGVHLTGANLGLISRLTLSQGGRMVGTVTVPCGACDTAEGNLTVPVTIRDSESVTYDISGAIPTPPVSGQPLGLGINGSMIDAHAAASQPFTVIVVETGESDFRVFTTSPFIVPQPLDTSALVNGVDQELFKFQVSSADAGHSLSIGSLTFHFGGGSGGTVSGLEVYLGSTALAPSRYRLVHSNDDAPIDSSTALRGFSDEFTVVFTETPGLLISGSGQVITIHGTPSGFASGDRLDTFFGDRIYSDAYSGSIWNTMNSNGQLMITLGTSSTSVIDPIIWTDLVPAVEYTGAWHIDDLSRIATLIAP